MSDSNERLEARRKSKRDWARRKAEERKKAGLDSYTSEWRRNNPEAYEEQKRTARDRRRLAREQSK